jgi:biotin operon repressor
MGKHLKMSPKARNYISKEIESLHKKGYTVSRATAAAYSEARTKGYKLPKYKKK